MAQSLLAHLELTRQSFAAASTLPSAVYSDPQIFGREQQRLFSQQWICVSHISALAKPGNYFLRQVAGQSVLLVRGGDQIIRAFFNVCRHRGSQLIDAAEGQGLSRIICPYHAWSYQPNGELQLAPSMPENFIRKDHGLIPLRCATRFGLQFVNLSSDAPPLNACLHDMPDLSRFKVADLVSGRRIEYLVQANWKLLCENYSECYHCPGAHPQLHKLTELVQRSDRPMEVGRCFNGGPMRLRDGVDTMSNSGKRGLPLIPGLSADDARYVHYYVLYPNLLLSLHPDYVLLHYLWPQSAGSTKVVCEWLVSPDALTKMASDLTDVVDFWDLTNRQDWALCERVQSGVVSAGYRQGPYQSAEDCVHMFDRWYADWLAAELQGEIS